jgi:hypothetical protein
VRWKVLDATKQRANQLSSAQRRPFGRCLFRQERNADASANLLAPLVPTACAAEPLGERIKQCC